MISRRSFVERLGLGAGARLLAPIAGTLLLEAQGRAQVSARKRAIFFLGGSNGIHWDWNFTPPEIRELDPKLAAPVLPGVAQFSWLPMLKALEPHRSRMLLIDGLANALPRSQHSGGYGALSCFTSANGGSNEYGGPPGGVTVDQFVAGTLGASTRVKSVLFGVNRYNATTGSFAAAAEKPEPFFVDAKLMFETLFGTLVTDAGGVGVNKGALKQRLLLDNLRADIKKLQGAFAGPERRKLDHYLSAIEELESRQRALPALSCKAPAPPTVDVKAACEDRLLAMNEMAILALACGMTNVVGVASNTRMSHQYFMKFTRIHVGTPFEAKGGVSDYGHDGIDLQKPAMDLIHDFHAGMISRTIAALSSIKEGDRTAWDNTVVVYTSDNGEAHHSSKTRWPVVVVGNAGGKLRADGRFLRYPAKGKPGWRSLADFYGSICHAVGVPTDTFGMGGVEPVRGPLTEILA